jgi:hypothetical protein
MLGIIKDIKQENGDIDINLSYAIVFNELKDAYDKEDIELGFQIIYGKCTIKEEHVKRNQREMRKKVIERDKKCIVSGNTEKCCEIAHIKRFVDSSDNENYDPNNYILLSSELHKLFDDYVWSINPNTSRIIINEENVNKDDVPINKYENIKIKLTEKQLKYMKIHYNNFVKKNNEGESESDNSDSDEDNSDSESYKKEVESESDDENDKKVVKNKSNKKGTESEEDDKKVVKKKSNKKKVESESDEEDNKKVIKKKVESESDEEDDKKVVKKKSNKKDVESDEEEKKAAKKSNKK